MLKPCKLCAANKCEMAAKDEDRDAPKLVKEMADELSKFHAWEEARALVAKAREVIGGS